MATEPGKNVEFAGLNKLLEVFNSTNSQMLMNYATDNNGFLKLSFTEFLPKRLNFNSTANETHGINVLVHYFNHVMGGKARLKEIKYDGDHLVLEGESVEIINLIDALSEITNKLKSVNELGTAITDEDVNDLNNKWNSLLSALKLYGDSQGLSLVEKIREDPNEFQQLTEIMPSFVDEIEVFSIALNKFYGLQEQRLEAEAADRKRLEAEAADRKRLEAEEEERRAAEQARLAKEAQRQKDEQQKQQKQQKQQDEEAERKRQEAEEAVTRLETLLSGEFQKREESEANELRDKGNKIIQQLKVAKSKLDTDAINQQVIEAENVSKDIVEYLEKVGKVRVYLVQGGRQTEDIGKQKLEIFKENEIVEIDVISPLRNPNPNPKKKIQFGPFTKVMPWASDIEATIDTIVQDIKPVTDQNNVTILAFGISGSGKTTYMDELKKKLCLTINARETSYFGLKKQDLSNIKNLGTTNSGNNSRRVNKEWFSKAIEINNIEDVDIDRSSPLNRYSSRVFSKETCRLDNKTYTFIDLPGLEDILTILRKYGYENSYSTFVNNPTVEIQKFTETFTEEIKNFIEHEDIKDHEHEHIKDHIIKLFIESIFISYALDLLKFFLIEPKRIKMENAQLINQLIMSKLLLESEKKQQSALFLAILSFRNFLFSNETAAHALSKERYVLLCHLPYALEAEYGPYNQQIMQSLAFANAISSTAAKR